jgi:hypothetical protein
VNEANLPSLPLKKAKPPALLPPSLTLAGTRKKNLVSGVFCFSYCDDDDVDEGKAARAAQQHQSCERD